MTSTVTHSSSKIFISSSVTANWVLSSSNTNLLVPVQPFILQSTDPSHFSIALESASIPLSIFTISTSTQMLYLNSRVFTIATGNYTISGLISYLNAYSDGVFTNSGNFVFVYDTVNNRITITSGSPETAVSLTIGTLTTCQLRTGIDTGVFTTLNALGRPFHISANQVNLTSTTGILVAINNLKTSNRDNQSIASGGTILARIPINCPMYKILTFYNPQPFFATLSDRVITSLNIQLLNDDYTPLVLQGNPNYFLTLRVDYVDKTNVIIPKTELQIAREALANNSQLLTDYTIKDLSSRARK